MNLIEKQTVRKCPICNNKISYFLHYQRFILPNNCFLPQDYDIVSCKKCGFVFADTSATQEKYDDYYENLSKYESNVVGTGTGTDENDKMRLNGIAKRICKYLNKYDNVIDIGCANGGLLSEIKEKGFYNLNGMDPSKVCVQNVRNRGFKAFQGSIFSLNKDKNNQFDFAILSGVLEHLYDVELAIKNVCKLVKYDGYVYIEVPDVLNYLSHYIVPYYYFDIEHINHFSINDIKNSFLKIGFELVEYGQCEYYASNKFKYPDIYTVFRKIRGVNGNAEQYADKSMNKTIKYIEKSKSDNIYDSVINDIFNSKEEIVIWGAGMHTYRLLASSNLNKCNIVGFIDNDIKKQGQTLSGKKVCSSELLKNYTGTILLCSAFNNDTIKNQLLKLNIKNKIIML